VARSTDIEQRVAAGAREAIARHGWGGATLQRVADASGVSRMTLHRRGIGREEILAFLTQAYEEEFQAALWPAVTGTGSGLERLERALVAVCDVTEAHLSFLASIDEETDTRIFHEQRGGIRSRPAYVSAVERLIADGIQDRSIRAVDDVAEAATIAVNAVDRTYRHLRRAHGWPPARARKALLDLVLPGLAAGVD
jgi:AcrR family transcriptional regulator